jgi:hypothetical protein
MKKNAIWIIVGVVAALIICCVGATAIYFLYTRGISTTAASPTTFVFPTPNMTLTALYRPPTLSLPSATYQPYVVPTYWRSTPTASPTVYIPTFPVYYPGSTVSSIYPRSNSYAIPPFMTIAPTMDGVWDEWDTTQYTINTLVHGAGNWEGNQDLLGSYQAGWNYAYLFLAFKVHDDRYVQIATGEEIYLGDSLDILIDTSLDGDLDVRSLDGDDYQIGISPGREVPGNNPEAFVWNPVSLIGPRSSIIVAAVGGDGLYRVEVAIPWTVLNVAPYTGLTMGFAVSISDNDESGVEKQQTMMSASENRLYNDPTTWGTILLK